ncbi:MAG: MarR family transcriptional regulator [Nitrososphaerota archaeon]
MVGKAVFVNMGFDPTATLEIISATSLSSSDILALVYPRTFDDISRLRSEQARTQIRNHINVLRTTGRNIELIELEIDLSDTSSAIGRLIETLIEIKRRGFYVYFELSGGVRAITVIMSLFSAWFPGLVDELTFVVEVTRVREKIPVISPFQLSSMKAFDILSLLADRRHLRRRDICKELGVSQSYISRLISRLKSMGVVEESLRVISLNVRYACYIPVFKNLKKSLQSYEKIVPSFLDKKD